MLRRQTSQRRTLRGPLNAAAAVALVASLGAAAPAYALDDGADNLFNSLTSLLTLGIGVGGDEVRPRIDYRERAPLVVPPNLSQLPPPAPSVATRDAAWPQDFDVTRQRQAQERARRPNNTDMTPEQLRQRSATSPVADPGVCVEDLAGRPCDPEQFWATLRNTRSNADTSRSLVAGQEPPRRSLTDPPAGFRTPTKAVRYTFEVQERIDLGDARAQQIEEARRARAISEGRNPDR
jgi:hypothetical protein